MSTFEEAYSAAHNIVTGFEQMGQMRDLFSKAMDAEKLLDDLDGEIEKRRGAFDAVNEATRKKDLEYQELTKKQKASELEFEQRMTREEQDIISEAKNAAASIILEAEKKVSFLKNGIADKERKLNELDRVVANLTGRISLREGHLNSLNEQIEKLKEIVTGGK
jgi:chromosome segregation ATPase